MLIPEHSLTEQQRRAIRTTDRSVVVSAAAGSGKTSVLAERCVYLLSEAPAPARCDIDELLVLTFTDAAAAEMRNRIRQALRSAVCSHPNPQSLERQLLLVDQATISTLHAYCLRLIRQNFMQLDVDPQAVVLNSDESRFLLFDSASKVARVRLLAGGRRAREYVDLVRHYAEGNEDSLANWLIDTHDFLRTLHRSDLWIDKAKERLTFDIERIRKLEHPDLSAALTQLKWDARTTAEWIHQHCADAKKHVESLLEFSDALSGWQHQLSLGAEYFDACMEEIRHYTLKTPHSRKKAEFDQRRVRMLDHARERYQACKRAFEKNVQRRFALFQLREWHEGLVSIRPYAMSLFDMIGELDSLYTATKKKQHALDFHDLEHHAYHLLNTGDDVPSEVARDIQRKYKYVLVDEYQDINPLQDALLYLISRESDPHRLNNLFCVGDVKQSIYRFRRAEPEIFMNRTNLNLESSSNEHIQLSHNFRSGRHLIDGVNHIFQRIMTEDLTGIDYGKEQLVHGRVDEVTPHPIELHLIGSALEQANQVDDGGERDVESVAGTDLECQARFIGERVSSLIASGEYSYGDMAILFRAAANRAKPMAGILQDMGIPTHVQTRGGFLEATEVQDMLALLCVLDNSHQDIPLASVMRSGICKIRFSESEMLAIRSIRRRAPFHMNVLSHYKEIKDEVLRDRLQEFCAKLDQLSRLISRMTLADGLWQIYCETDCLTRASAQTHGAQRRANLLLLHRRSEQFSRSTTRNALSDFLDHMELLRRHSRDQGVANPATNQSDAVRIMTVHHSKGLEFPVVFVAGLERKFNLVDTVGSIGYDPKEFLSLPVVDPIQRIRYPSLQSARVKYQARLKLLAEEMRILYVALTRARDRLILVGSAKLEKFNTQKDMKSDGCLPIGTQELRSAQNYLDWIIPAILDGAPEKVQFNGEDGDVPLPQALFRIQCHDPRLPQPNPEVEKAVQEKLETMAKLQPLSENVPDDTQNSDLEAITRRLDFAYPGVRLNHVPSVLSVSEFKKRSTVWREDSQPDRRTDFSNQRLRTPALARNSKVPSPTEIGEWTHLFLQLLDYTRSDQLAPQLFEMCERGWLTNEQASHINLESIQWYLETHVGRSAIQNAGKLHRELVFIARSEVSEFDPKVLPITSDDFILTRGIIDLVIPEQDGYSIVDFKTDRITSESVATRQAVYQDQIRRYAMTLERMWHCRVYHTCLVFLHPRCIEITSPEK